MKEKRVKLLFALFFLGMVVLFSRSFHLQILDHHKYTSEVQDLATRIIRISPKRGNIYDRNGKLLAWNQRIYRITNLGSTLDQEIEDELYYILKDFVDNPYTVIDRLNFQKRVNLEINSIAAQKIANLDKNLIVEERYVRKYAHESLYHLLGYVDNEGTARSGLELVFDKQLRGSPGFSMINTAFNKSLNPSLQNVPPINGNNIFLTIDLDLQIKTYEYLNEKEYKGTVILSNPNNGEILVFVSAPSPDPNAFSQGMTNLEFQNILNNSNKPLLNRVTSSLYPPGSILKPFVAYGALEAGISPEATILSTGKYYLRNSQGIIIGSYSDWKNAGHGETNLIKSLRASVNSYYYWLGEKLGIEHLKVIADKFEIDKKTGITVPNEKSGVFPDPEWKRANFNTIWYPGETLLTYIGQGYVTLTPLQVLRIYNIFATKGDYYQFDLFLREENIFSETVKNRESILKDSYPMNEEYLEYIYQGMIEVTTFRGSQVEDAGTAYNSFYDFPYVVAGKTGTAEVSGGKLSHSWFAGFLPADDPQYSIVVLIENGGQGSTAAAPIARKILDDLASKYLN
jgi:penicillin-binding protein 2